MRRKEESELSAEAPEYLKAQRLAASLIGIASIIPMEDKDNFQIPSFIDCRSMRNAIARRSLNEPQECDYEQLDTATNIIRWLDRTLI